MNTNLKQHVGQIKMCKGPVKLHTWVIFKKQINIWLQHIIFSSWWSFMSSSFLLVFHFPHLNYNAASICLSGKLKLENGQMLQVIKAVMNKLWYLWRQGCLHRVKGHVNSHIYCKRWWSENSIWNHLAFTFIKMGTFCKPMPDCLSPFILPFVHKLIIIFTLAHL